MFNLQTIVGLLVTAGIIWRGLTRIDLSQTIPAFAIVGVEYVIAGGALVVVIAILLPNNPSVPIRFVFC